MGDENSPQDSVPKKEIPLFRKEALEYRKGSFLGKVTIISPISFSVWAWGIFLVAVVLMLFITFGKYSKHRQARGILTPDKGLINVYAKTSGVIAERFVRQGDRVTKNQLLYLISTEQHSLANQGLSEQLVESLERQIVLQKNRLQIYEKNLESYRKLLEKQFISELEYQHYYDDYLNHEISLRDLERRLTEVKSSGDYTVRAPADGTVSTLVAMVGDRVTADRPLASIVPTGAILRGLLFVNTEDIGFVKLGQKVLLKYDAYPYQNFGLYESVVTNIDESILSIKDLDLPINPDPKNPNPYSTRPFYRVVVELKSQTVKVYGEDKPLTVGMTVEGEIIGEKRNIWQWILNPIYTLRGSLISR